jgi:outer membrane protein
MRSSLLLLLCLSPALAKAEPRRLGVEEVVAAAVREHPRLVSARARAAAAVAQQGSARGRLFAPIVVSDEYQHWNKPFAIAFAAPGAAMAGAEAPAPVTVRDRNTNTFTVAASQPLLGLLHRNQDLKSQARSAEALAAFVRVSEGDLRDAVEIEYLNLFEAKSMQDVAKASETELAQQVSSTEAKVHAGSQTTSDLLRVQVALANARQQEIAATTQMTVSRANLLAAMGLPPDRVDVEFADPASLLAAAERPATSQAAVERRPELEQARLRAEALDHAERARGFDMLPEVNVEAAYSRVDGQTFAPKDAAFVGVKVEWPVWEWGASNNARRAAAQEAAAARADLEAERRDAVTELTVRRAEFASATSAVELAQKTVASAEEAYRVTDALVRAGAGTTTDLLDSQSKLTEARVSLLRARYGRAIAHVRLERASGLR